MSRVSALALLGLVSACKSKSRPHDDALKQQILSGDHSAIRLPAPVVDLAALADSAAQRKLVFVAPVTVLERRFSHFQIKAKVTLDGPPAVGNRVYEHTLKEADRGTFSIHHGATGVESTDWIAVDHEAFVKHGKGQWRKKPFTLQHAETLKNEIPLTLVDVYTLFGEQMQMTAGAEGTQEGRATQRFSVTADRAAKTGEGKPSLLLRSDVDAVSLQGEVVLDKETGAMLSADLKAVLALTPIAAPAKAGADDAPAAPAQNKTEVKMRVQWTMDSLTADAKLAPEKPTDVVEDKGFERPAADALGFWKGVTPAKDDKEKEEDD